MTVLPPDGRLRAPRRALPPGTVDCHAHIFDRPERYFLSRERKYTPPLCTREAWLALHAALGVARGVQVNATPYGFDNTITEDFLAEHPSRFVGVATIDPRIGEKELRKLDKAGFRAARCMDQFANAATTAMLEPLAKRIAPLGWHLEINIAKSADWVDLEPRLARCPVPLVFDHLGRPRGGEGVDSPGFRAILRLLTQRDDCWTKISSWYRLSDSGAPEYADMAPFVITLLRERPDGASGAATGHIPACIPACRTTPISSISSTAGCLPTRFARRSTQRTRQGFTGSSSCGSPISAGRL